MPFPGIPPGSFLPLSPSPYSSQSLALGWGWDRNMRVHAKIWWFFSHFIQLLWSFKISDFKLRSKCGFCTDLLFPSCFSCYFAMKYWETGSLVRQPMFSATWKFTFIPDRYVQYRIPCWKLFNVFSSTFKVWFPLYSGFPCWKWVWSLSLTADPLKLISFLTSLHLFFSVFGAEQFHRCLYMCMFTFSCLDWASFIYRYHLSILENSVIVS